MSATSLFSSECQTSVIRAPDVRRRGIFLVSLDFELQWGVRDLLPLSAWQKEKLLAARRTIPLILDLFEEFSIHATWAVVGLLFAHTREEVQQFLPCFRPGYRNRNLDAYGEALGKDEEEDPYHFAPSLVAEIAKRPAQEIGCHSFSHYYSLEDGQTVHEFAADLSSAVAIMRKSGYIAESYVFPRNQVNEIYLPILERAGVICYRTTEDVPAKRARPFSEQRRWSDRLARILDSYVDIHGNQTSETLSQHPVALPASRYLRPHRVSLDLLEPLRFSRIANAMEYAATQQKVFHLWWHPEDFALDPDRNLRFLRKVLCEYRSCERRFGMTTMSMREAATAACHKSGQTRSRSND